jgi:putative ATP-dependent endonuclease of OLD family
VAKIHTLKIANFKGINEFHQVFFQKDLICVIGRGDSGKSTILEAISHVLSPQWNVFFQDTDFTNCDTENPIEIEATLTELPIKLLQDDKYGLYMRGIKDGQICDEIEQSEDLALTIKLIVKKDLEPQWHVYNERQGLIRISASDRACLNVFMVSDYVDRHFSWNKGNPLYSLLKQEDSEHKDQEENIIMNALREAKTRIDSHPFSELDSPLKKVIASAKALGMDISKVSNTIDFKDLFMKDDKISLHDFKVPFRLKGKGSKRLISIAIQTALSEAGGIMLIDEVEQGLEPDRVQHLVSVLKQGNTGQIFLTTHSRDVIVELDATNLFLMRSKSKQLFNFSSDFQGLLRINPEAFFSNKIIICEGATEVGLCRALNNFKISQGHENASYQGVKFVDGKGANAIFYLDGFNKAGYATCLFCDSDLDKKDKTVSQNKERLFKSGQKIIDWEQGDCLEVAIFKNLSSGVVVHTLDFAASLKKELSQLTEEDAVKSNWDSVKSKFGNGCTDSFSIGTDTPELRIAIGKAASGQSWFKNQAKAQRLGEIIFEHWDKLGDSKLKKQFIELSKFIDGNGL